MTTTASVHVDAETHHLLSRVQLAIKRQFDQERRPYDARLVRNMVYALALERGAAVLFERHCPDQQTDVKQTALQLAELFQKTNAGVGA